MRKIFYMILLCLSALEFTDCSNSKEDNMEEWKSITASEITENPIPLFGNGLALSVKSKDKVNAMAIGWGSLGVLFDRDRPVVTFYLRDDRYTKELLDSAEYFTLTQFPDSLHHVVEYLGTHSGRNEDKMKGTGMTVKYTENGAPYFDEGTLVIECRKIYAAPFQLEEFAEMPQSPALEASGGPGRFVVHIGEIIDVMKKE